MFGTAANNGQMIAELSSSHRAAEMFRQMAQALTGRTEDEESEVRAASPLLDKLMKRYGVTDVRSSVACSVSVPPQRAGTVASRRRATRLEPAQPAPLRRGSSPRSERRASSRRQRGRRRPCADSIRRSRRAAGRGADPGQRAPGAANAPSPPLAPTATELAPLGGLLRRPRRQIFGALIEAIDLGQLAKLDADSAREEIRDIVNEIIAIKTIVMSISEQEELLDDICNDVLGYGPLEPLLARDDIADIMVNGSGTTYHRGEGQDPEDRHPLPRQPATAEHLPAHRQPDRPARRRILADLRRAPAGRLARQRHRSAARDRRPGAHHPQIQEGQAHARAAGQVRHDHAAKAPKSSR